MAAAGRVHTIYVVVVIDKVHAVHSVIDVFSTLPLSMRKRPSGLHPTVVGSECRSCKLLCGDLNTKDV